VEEEELIEDTEVVDVERECWFDKTAEENVDVDIDAEVELEEDVS
jgi:hypothetical protein